MSRLIIASVCLIILLLSCSLVQARPKQHVPNLLLQRAWQQEFPETAFVELRARSSRYFVFYRRPTYQPGVEPAHQAGEELMIIDRRTGAIYRREESPEFYADADERALYVTKTNGAAKTLKSIDWATGHEHWHTNLPFQHAFSFRIVPQHPELVLCTTLTPRAQEPSIICLDSATGNPRWQANGFRYYVGTMQERLIIAGINENNRMGIYHLSPDTGKALPDDPTPFPGLNSWSPELATMEYVPQSNLYIFNDRVVDTGLDSSSVFVTDALFKTLWREDGSGGYSGPQTWFLYGGNIFFYLLSREGSATIAARQLQTGKRLWSASAPHTLGIEPNQLVGVWHNAVIHRVNNRLIGRHLSDGKALFSCNLEAGIVRVSIEGNQLLMLRQNAKQKFWQLSAYN